jgi:hypothetical protein
MDTSHIATGMQGSVGFIAHMTHMREMLAMGWLKIN